MRKFFIPEEIREFLLQSNPPLAVEQFLMDLHKFWDEQDRLANVWDSVFQQDAKPVPVEGDDGLTV